MTVEADQLVIRAASLDDIEPVRALLGAVWCATYEPLIGRERVETDHAAWHAADVLSGQLGGATTSFLVAQDGPNGIVGHAFSSAARPPVLLIARLYVSPAHQRQGIGTKLMREMLARHPNATTARLSVVEGNGSALRFYRRLGFAIIGEGEDDGVRELHLERRLG